MARCRELEWLIETAWEHGKELVLQEQHAQGLSFMAAALSLMDLCEDYKDHKEVRTPARCQSWMKDLLAPGTITSVLVALVAELPSKQDCSRWCEV